MSGEMVDMRLAWWVRPLNTVLDVTKLSQIDRTGPSWSALENIARRRSGASAELDEEFRTEMQLLFNEFVSNDSLSPLGQIAIRQTILRRLTTRLQLAHELHQHPEIDDVPIRRPLFIVGLPRTGTTLLHRLLHCDPTNRALLLWQLITPFSLDTSQTEIHKRIRYAQRQVRFTLAAAPVLRAIHELDAHQPEECFNLLPHHAQYHLLSPVPQYLKWLNQRDLQPDYQYFKRQLQALQWQQPERRWVLKSPFHLGALDALLSVFPDARIIQTHREPATVLASFCSLTEAMAMVMNRKIDRAQIGQDSLAIWSEAMSSAVHVRQTADPDRFIDIYYNQLTADPIKTIEDINRHFGENLSPAGRNRMRDYLDQDRHSTHGKHRYSLERYGLTESVVHHAFADYRAYFNT